MRIDAKTRRNVYAMCVRSDRASILHATVGGWEHSAPTLHLVNIDFKKEYCMSGRAQGTVVVLLTYDPLWWCHFPRDFCPHLPQRSI